MADTGRIRPPSSPLREASYEICPAAKGGRSGFVPSSIPSLYAFFPPKFDGLSEKQLPTFYRFPYQNYHFRGIPSVDPSKYDAVLSMIFLDIKSTDGEIQFCGLYTLVI